MSARFGDERLPERFWDKVEPEPNTGCWLWSGAADLGGYGMFAYPRHSPVVSRKAHRVAYLALVGEIPGGLVLDHLCRVRCCVNPEHLRTATQRQNILSGSGACAVHAKKDSCTNCGAPFTYYISPTGKTQRRCVPCKNAAQRLRGRERYRIQRLEGSR